VALRGHFKALEVFLERELMSLEEDAMAEG
jgi:hypothetical protein